MKLLALLIVLRCCVVNCAVVNYTCGLTDDDMEQPLANCSDYAGEPNPDVGPIIDELDPALNPEEWSGYKEGDLLYQPDSNYSPSLSSSSSSSSSVPATSKLWPNGTIPFVINGNYTDAQKQNILDAMQELQNRTCIKFVPYNPAVHFNYLSIESEATGCWSNVGMIGGKNTVNLQRACAAKKCVCEHELMHCIGRKHEHIRLDRDSYITVNTSNIIPSHLDDFTKRANTTGYSDYNVVYGFNSTLHYGPYAFAADPNYPTIIALNPNNDTAMMGQRDFLPEGDCERIRQMYKCTTTTPPP